MGTETGIAWTDSTWNPLRGCSRVSAGCENCYAEAMAGRFSGHGMPYEGLVRKTAKGMRWTGDVRLILEHLNDPLRWTRPRRVFVNSMSDLFHQNVPFEWIAAIFAVMAGSQDHVFQVLTKRPERMLEFFRWVALDGEATMCMRRSLRALSPCAGKEWDTALRCIQGCSDAWPLPNVWMGVSAATQETFNERVPLLLQCPAAVRWVSLEPLVEDVKFTVHTNTVHLNALTGRMVDGDGDVGEASASLDWVVVGGESGPRARMFDIVWARNIAAACAEAETPCFIKQLGSNPLRHDVYDMTDDEYRQVDAAGWCVGDPMPRLRHSKGGDPSEWPEDLRCREYPR